MKIGENDYAHEIRFLKKKIIELMGGGGGGEQIFVKSFAALVSVYKNTHIGLKCLNANFVMPHNCRGGGAFF